MTLTRRQAARGLLAAPLLGLPGAALAQGQPAGPYPSRPVTIYVPFAAGGSTDSVARFLAQALAASMGQPFVVENRPGASGTVSQAALARARPDGYTLGVTPNGTFAMAPFMFERLPYDNERGFTPIGMLATNAMFICVHPQAPYRTLDDLLAAARAQPGKISFASAGSGVANHLGVELLQDMSNTEMLHVPYRSGALGVQAVIAKETTLSFVDTVTAIPFLKSGELRALAVTAAERNRQMPDVPTVAELGLPGYRASTDFGFFGPAGMPADVVAKLSDAMRAAMTSPEMRSKLEPLAIDVVGGTQAEFAPYAQAEMAKWGGLIRKRNIKPE